MSISPREGLRPPATEELITRSPAQTRRLAQRLLAELPLRAVLALYGELGSGKTCFVQGLAEALGVPGPVTSPTFTLIQEYAGVRPLVHVDLYRIRSAAEAEELGIEEYFEREGIVVIEWAERAEALLPPHTWRLTFEHLAQRNERRIVLRRPCAVNGDATAR